MVNKDFVSPESVYTAGFPSDFETEAGSKSKASRERLLLAALRCFAEHGYAKTSTRMIAEAAGANVAAIRYYFQDKAGIYRAAFTESMNSPTPEHDVFHQPGHSMEAKLQAFYATFIEPLKQGEISRMCAKLHMREMIEPTGLWQEEVDNSIKPQLQAISSMITEHLGLTQPDDDIHRLAFAIAAQGAFLLIARDIYEKVAPQLINTPAAIDVQHQRLVGYALTLIAAEQHKRQQRSRI